MKALHLILALYLAGAGSHSIATKLLLTTPHRKRTSRMEKRRAHDRARKRVERFTKRYYKTIELLLAAKPPACNPLQDFLRPKPGKTRGTGGQTTIWPGRLGPTQRLVIELLAAYPRGALITNLIWDAQEYYGVKLTYHQVAKALERLHKRGIVARIARGLYILQWPRDPWGPPARLLVENARLESPYRKEPLVKTSSDGLTLLELSLTASRERATHVSRLEIYIPLNWFHEAIKKLLTGNGTWLIKIYHNKEQDMVKLEAQIHGATTPLGITTVDKWSQHYIKLVLIIALAIIAQLSVDKDVQGYVPDRLRKPKIIKELYKAGLELVESARMGSLPGTRS